MWCAPMKNGKITKIILVAGSVIFLFGSIGNLYFIFIPEAYVYSVDNYESNIITISFKIMVIISLIYFFVKSNNKFARVYWIVGLSVFLMGILKHYMANTIKMNHFIAFLQCAIMFFLSLKLWLIYRKRTFTLLF